VDLFANWLWQGCVVALAATIALHVWPRMSATTRYRGWWVALALVLLLPLIPAAIAFGRPASETIVASTAPSPSLTVSLPPLPWWPAALMLAVWMVWVAGSLVRLGGALISLWRVKASVTPFPPEREVQLHGWMSVRRTGRHAALVVSEEVRSAGVLGLRAPAIAVSPVMLCELSNSELDQILVHEWAHVQRRDDFGGLCQMIVTAVAGLHPAVWWINRRLHVEREAACDDWTVNVTGAAKGYAACLTKLAAMGNDGLLIAAAWSSSSLRPRIVRLLDRGRNRSTRFTVASVAIVPVLGAVAVTAASVELVVSRPFDMPSLDRTVTALQVARSAVVAPQPDADERTPFSAEKISVALSEVQSDAGRADSTERISGSSTAQTAPQTAATTGAAPVLPSVGTVAVEPANLPGTSEPIPALEAASATPSAATKTVTPWAAAADAGVALGDAGVAIGDAGVAVGRGSKRGAVATAGFFSRLGKSIARSF
jgi:beta-lactamase regulating signal transducer with metallopeptidase domain